MLIFYVFPHLGLFHIFHSYFCVKILLNLIFSRKITNLRLVIVLLCCYLLELILVSFIRKELFALIMNFLSFANGLASFIFGHQCFSLPSFILKFFMAIMTKFQVTLLFLNSNFLLLLFIPHYPSFQVPFID